MSSPSQVPYYRPRPRSIVGPLVLITIGVLFLLRTTGVISPRSFHNWMVHYWPLLLIVWGVAKLLEHVWARQHGEPTPRLGAGGIVLSDLLHRYSVRLPRVRRTGIGAASVRISGSMTIWTICLAAAMTLLIILPSLLTAGSEIKILSAQGDITVTASEDNQVHAVVRKSVRSDSQENANRAE